MYLWTFQKVSACEQAKEGYIPDFSKSYFLQENPELKQLYDNILLSFESHDGYMRKGLLFCFMGGENGEFFPIPSIQGFINIFSKNYGCVKTLLDHFKSEEYYLVCIDIDPNRYPLIPININDFQFLMPPYFVSPPYESTDIARLYTNIFRNGYAEPKLACNLVQVVYPYLDANEIVEAYDAKEVIQCIEDGANHYQ